MSSSRVDERINTVVVSVGYGPDQQIQLQYTNARVIRHGTFGVVHQAKIIGSEQSVAIKKVLQDKRYKNRELEIMRSLEHPNIVAQNYFYSTTEKLFAYQLCRALTFIHFKGVTHRDLKPLVILENFVSHTVQFNVTVASFQNILVDCEKGELKVCDFGSAKHLIPGETNVSYICSRYYRAPELIFGSTSYKNSIDIWSAGCVFAEMFIGLPLFQGDSGVDQLVEIIKLLGTPTVEQVRIIIPAYEEFNFPHVKPHPWNKVFPPSTPVEALDLISR